MKTFYKHTALLMSLLVMFASSGYAVFNHTCGCDHNMHKHANESSCCFVEESDVNSDNCYESEMSEESCCNGNDYCSHGGCVITVDYNKLEIESDLNKVSIDTRLTIVDRIYEIVPQNTPAKVILPKRTTLKIPQLYGKKLVVTLKNIKIPSPDITISC